MMDESPASGDDLALEAEIERIRAELNTLGESLGISHPDVLAMSKQLDALILRFHSMRRSLKGLPPAQKNCRRN